MLQAVTKSPTRKVRTTPTLRRLSWTWICMSLGIGRKKTTRSKKMLMPLLM